MTMSFDPADQDQQQRPGPQANLQSHDPYEILGLQRGVALREIKRAYFSLVREYPPEEDPASFKIIRAAYEQLRNPEVKSETDLFLFQPPYPWEGRKRRPHLDLEVHVEDLLDLMREHLGAPPDSYQDDYKPIKV
jgi:curved DNA-binding protein CbpA